MTDRRGQAFRAFCALANVEEGSSAQYVAAFDAGYDAGMSDGHDDGLTVAERNVEQTGRVRG